MIYFGNGIAAAAVVLGTLAQPAVAVTGSLPDLSLRVGEEVRVELASVFKGADRYALAPSSAPLPHGLALVGARIEGAATEPVAQRHLVIRGANDSSFADTAFSIEVAALAPPPVPTLSVAPTASGDLVVGARLTLAPGEWEDAAEVRTELLVRGVAVATPYVVQPADDGAPFVLREIATGPGGVETYETVLGTAAWPAPGPLPAIADVVARVGDPAPVIQVSGEGLAGGAWSVTGPGASIDQNGLLTLSTASAALGTVTVRYVNSGGVAQTAFLLSVAPATGGSGPWTPAEIQGATYAVYLATDATVTRSGSDVTGWTASYASMANPPVFGRSAVGATQPGATPATWDAANSLIDFGTGRDRALVGALPFTLSIGTARGFTVVWATVGATAGDAINTRMSNDTSRYRFGPDSWMGSVPTGANNGAAKIGVIEGWSSGSTRLRSGYADGLRFTNAQTVTSGSFNGDATAAILGSSNAANLMPGKIAAVAFFDRRLTSDERERVEGWLRHAHPALSGVSIVTADGGAHPYGAAAPQLGAPPVLASAFTPLSAFEDVLIDDIDLRERFFFATAFSAAGLPPGMTLNGPILRGAPTEAGTWNATITALNDSGATNATLTIAVAAAPAVAATLPGLWSAAFDAGPGATIAVNNLAGIVQAAHADNGPDFLTELATLTGQREVVVVGATDFRRADWAENLDAEVKVHIPHRDASGALVNGATTRTHPMWGQDAARFEALAAPAGPVPIDHANRGGVWTPAGLRVWDGVASNSSVFGGAVGANALRHLHPHDGHVVWIAEYRLADGSTIVLADELSNTRGANPRLRHRKRVIDNPRPTHLLRFVTLQIRSHASLMDQTPATHWDARRWQIEPKRRRADYTPDATVGSWSALMSAIADLPGTAAIPGKAAGEPYVIALAPGLHAGTSTTRRPTFTAGARNRLALLTQNRVFVVGTPGATIVHPPSFPGVSIDFGWITFAQPEIPPSPTSTFMDITGANHLRFFGCVFDGLDGTPAFGKPTANTVFEIYDSVITGMGNGVGTGPLSNSAPQPTAYLDRLAAAPRIVIARSLYDVTNDGMTIYGAGNVRFEGNYVYGNGGLYLNNGMAHRDAGGQFTANGTFRQPSTVAYYDNVFDTGPNRNLWISDRAATNTLMMQGLQWEAFDYVANIVVQTPTGDGVTRLSSERKNMALYAARSAWHYSTHFAYNLLLHYPTDMTPQGVHPDAAFNTFSGGGTAVFDGWSATGNLVVRDALSGQVGFSRLINLFPEERAAAARADHLDPDEAFASFPVFTGTWEGGYAGDWSGTTYGGTSREGYIAPQDVAVAPALRTWGPGGGPGLPQHGAYLDRYLNLPADINAHLGWVDAAGDPLPSGYGPDWFGPGAWSPAAFTPNATLTPGQNWQGWSPPAGLSQPDRYGLIVNTRIATAGAGTLIRERAADGSDWRVRIEADGRPRFVMRDAEGAVVHDVTGQQVVGAGDHLAAVVNVRYRRHKAEGFSHNTSLRRVIWEHYRGPDAGQELVAVFYAQDTAPTRQTPPAGVKMLHFWADTAHTNRVYEWTGAEWALANGEISQWATAQFSQAARSNPNPDYTPSIDDSADPRSSPTRNLWNHGLRRSTINGPRVFRIILKDRLTGAPSTVLTPSSGVQVAGVWHDMDRLYYARNAAEYGLSNAVYRWLDGAWTTAGASTGAPDAGVIRGEVGVFFRVNNREPIRSSGWRWGNEDVLSGIMIDPYPVDPPQLSFPFGFQLGVAELRVETRVVVVKARVAGDPPGTPELYLAREGGFRTMSPSLYTVTGGDDPDGGVITLSSIDALYAAARARPENVAAAVDRPDVTLTRAGVEMHPLTRARVVLRAVMVAPASEVELDPSDDGDGEIDTGEALGADRMLPTGVVTLGGATDDPFTGTVRFIEARRLDGTRAAARPVDGASTAIVHRLARAPVDPATGARDHPIMGAADVWVVRK